ncbi:MAG: aminopeptidase P family protein [Rikenellaceae bacterium]
MINNIDTKLESLRKIMQNRGYDFVVVPSNDPHFSEYTPKHWKCREFISGFNGSAGKVLISMTEALLWSDSRYFLQAEEQLKGTSYTFMKENALGVPTLEQYVSQFKDKTVAVNTNLISIANYANFTQQIGENSVTDCGDLFTELWCERPALGEDKIITLQDNITGESSISKIERVKKELWLKENDIYIVSPLDQIAWLLNMRGTDIEFNPLNVCYVAIESDCVRLFIKKEKISDTDSANFEKMSVFVSEYSEFEDYLQSLRNKNIILNKNYTSYKYLSIVSEKNAVTFEQNENSVISCLKSVKNVTEIAGFRKAMIEDGIAMTRFYMWLEKTLKNDEKTVTEYELGEKLASFRAKSELYFSESFGAIVGYAANGAIVHYKAEKETCSVVKSDNFLLIDSGAQYLCGTTDITRTVHLGEPSDEQKKDFTLVLQGHINLGSAIFPKNTRGAQLDFLARQPLCSNLMNFMHGTGHGIGHFLNVHEGPQSIRMNENPVVLECGMVTSNEPAVYKTGEYGIRSENLILCKEHSKSNFGEFHCFETITLFPFDLKSLNCDMLTSEQKLWLNNYHELVYNTLAPHLSDEEKSWLKDKTTNI